METQPPSIPKNSIHILRGVPVILAADLAVFYSTTTKAVNQYRSRNQDRFAPGYAFQLTKEEWELLKSQNVTSSSGHGGTRVLPWAYTEHGVAMMSMGMKGPDAVRLSKIIIDTFVDYRRGTLPSKRILSGRNAEKQRQSIQQKLYKHIEKLLDAELPTSSGVTIRDELGSIADSALKHIQEVMNTPAKRNEKISAEVTKLIAEAEKIYAETRMINAQTDTLNMQNYMARLGMLKELQVLAIELERNDWLKTFDDTFDEANHTLGISE